MELIYPAAKNQSHSLGATQLQGQPQALVNDQSGDWRAHPIIRSVQEVLEYVKVSKADVALPKDADLRYFPLRVPQTFLDKIIKGDAKDPLLRQILPLATEFVDQPGYVKDPLKEVDFNPVPGLIHKYPNRVLLVATQACAIHCRYCFRRHFPYDGNGMSNKNLALALDYVTTRPEIDEVILSGGDPLSLTDEKLLALIGPFADLSHVKRIRIHSRMVATLPMRVTNALVQGLSRLPAHVVVVTHVNHPHEVDAAFAAAVQKLRQANIHVLNQSVLLAGVNNCAQVLRALHDELFNAGVLPYYLHLLDPVEGAHHFDVSEHEAKVLMQALLVSSPGYLVPKLVNESAGMLSKRHIDLGID